MAYDLADRSPLKMKEKFPIVMLGSGTGSTIDFFCEKSKKRELPAQIVSIIADHFKAGVLSVAKKHQIPFHVVEYKKKEFHIWDKELSEILLFYQPQLILLAGFLKKIGPTVLNNFKNKILNSHPALLPDFSGPGMYGLRVHQAVIKQKRKETGVTIHLVNENYDEGPILCQKKIKVFPEETALELEKRVKSLEKTLYLKTVSKIISEAFSPNNKKSRKKFL